MARTRENAYFVTPYGCLQCLIQRYTASPKDQNNVFCLPDKHSLLSCRLLHLLESAVLCGFLILNCFLGQFAQHTFWCSFFLCVYFLDRYLRCSRCPEAQPVSVFVEAKSNHLSQHCSNLQNTRCLLLCGSMFHDRFACCVATDFAYSLPFLQESPEMMASQSIVPTAVAKVQCHFRYAAFLWILFVCTRIRPPRPWQDSRSPFL